MPNFALSKVRNDSSTVFLDLLIQKNIMFVPYLFIFFVFERAVGGLPSPALLRQHGCFLLEFITYIINI